MPATDISNAGTITIGGEFTVHRVGFGAMRITGEGVWGEPADRDSAKDVLRRAVELGVDFIDTADSYGPDVSEDLIREALHPYDEDLVIATKAGLVRPGPGEWVPNGRPDHIRQACEGSLKRLGIETIQLYQFHRIDPDVPIEESIGTFTELRDEGKVRLIGVSNVDLDQLEAVRELVDVVSVQNRFNVADRESTDVVDRCDADGIVFIPWAPIDSGDLGSVGHSLDEIAEEHTTSIQAVALAWLLARSTTMLPIPGTGSMDHLEENVAAASIELSDDELRILDDVA